MKSCIAATHYSKFKRFNAKTITQWGLAAAISIASWGANAQTAADAQTIVMASTTSTEQSGLFGYLLPAFKKASGIDIKVVAVGTGQALDMARRGDADVVFVHDQAAEEKFMAEGY
ncbi:MAG: substrate-binding domain-containing protein, partial [Rhodoferax sp.]